MNQRPPLLSYLPQMTEVVVDIGVGLLAIVLFYPLLYGAYGVIVAGKDPLGSLVSIFPDALATFKTLGAGAVFLALFLGFVIGVISRHFFWLVMSLLKFKCVWRFFCRIAHCTLKREYNYSVTLDFLEREFIDRMPFWQIGKTNYADFRSQLMKPEHELGSEKPYWDHEEFLFFQHNRAFAMFLSLFVCYFLYAAGLVFYSWGIKGRPFFEANPMLMAIVILLLILIITFVLFRGMLWHGSAFVVAERAAYCKYLKYLSTGIWTDKEAYSKAEPIEVTFKNKEDRPIELMGDIEVKSMSGTIVTTVSGSSGTTIWPGEWRGWRILNQTTSGKFRVEVETSSGRFCSYMFEIIGH